MKRRALTSGIGLVAALLLLISPLNTQTKPGGQQATVRSFLADFIHAFNNLDWEKFRSAFTDDATVFYPRGTANRANGRAEIEAHFREVFEQIRAGRTQGPYMDLQPRSLQIEIWGGTAVVTFHLDDRPGYINRRTLVLRRVGREWKIAHLHASEVAAETNAPPK
ncbi:MAG: nuclear transport factor 2 family protein [Candidatus Acidiferrum sp.]